MKKPIVVLLSLALTASTLSACGSNTASEDTTQAATAKTVSTETTVSDTTEAPVPDTETEASKELTDSELTSLFQEVYTVYGNSSLFDNDADQLAWELEGLTSIATAMHYTLPSDVQERYIDWRPLDEDTTEIANTSGSNISTEVKTASFTEVNETVYATSTVNIRASYTTSSDKVGSLSTGGSLTRTGIGTGDAEGWSRVEYNGKTCYISSSFLTTTKPTTSSSGKTTGTTSGNTNKSNGSSSGTSSGNSDGSSYNEEQTYGGYEFSEVPGGLENGGEVHLDPNNSGWIGDDGHGDVLYEGGYH
jgi:hypothetical protein